MTDLAKLGYFLLPIPAGCKDPPPKGWTTAKVPYDIPLGGNVAIGTRGDVAIMITNDEASTCWATAEFGPPNVRSVRGGHWYFRAREGQANEANATTSVGQMELHVRNKYAMVPPSTHPSGVLYRWDRPLPALKDLPESPDLRDLWHPKGEHHGELLRISSAKAHDGKDVGTITAELRVWRAEHLPDPLAHSDSELLDMATTAVAKFGAKAIQLVENPRLAPPVGAVSTSTSPGTVHNMRTVAVTDGPVKVTETPITPVNDQVTVTEGPALFNAVRNALERHVYFPEAWEYDIATLYIFQSHIAGVLPAFFYVFLDGTKGTGKTTVLDHISRLTDSLRLQSFTLATLSRSMTQFRPVSVDEFDVVEKDVEVGGPVAALVRQGYKRDAAPRKVCVGRSGEILDLEIAGPKALTFRDDIDDALKDRGFRLPTVAGSSYDMVLLGMAPEFGDIPGQLRSWAEAAKKKWSPPRAAARIKEDTHRAKVVDVLQVLEATRNSELVTVAVLVSDIIGIDLTETLRAAKAAKDRDELASRGVEDLLEALREVAAKAGPKLGEAEYYLISMKELRTALDRIRLALKLLPVRNHELARFRKDAGIRDEWRIKLHGDAYWKIPKTYPPLGDLAGSSPSSPWSPSPQDDRVTRVDKVTSPLDPDRTLDSPVLEEDVLGPAPSRGDILRSRFPANETEDELE